MPVPRNLTNDERKSALRQVILYIIYEMKVKPNEIYHGAKITKDEYDGFMLMRSVNRNDVWEKLCSFLCTFVEKQGFTTRIHSYALTMFGVALGNDPNFPEPPQSSVDHTFLSHSERSEEELTKFANAYIGIYEILRYSGGLTIRGTETEPYVVREVIKIYRDVKDAALLRFDMRYQYTYDKDRRDITAIVGSVIPIRDKVYFVGLEEWCEHPLIIATARSYNATYRFVGMVLRRHRMGPIMASRMVFQRVSGEIDEDLFEEIIRKIGTVKAETIEAEIEPIRHLITNLVELCGQSALVIAEHY